MGSPILSDETLAFLILPLVTPFPRPPRHRPPRADEPVDSLDVEDDLLLGNTRSLTATEFEEEDVDFAELMAIGTKVSRSGISCNREYVILDRAVLDEYVFEEGKDELTVKTGVMFYSNPLKLKP